MTKPQRRRSSANGEPVRDALVRAGLTLFSRHPVDALAVDDIVREARVAKGSFYTYFPDKDALLASIVGDIRGRIETQVTLANRGVTDAASRVARGICCYLRYVADEPEHGAVLVRNDRSGRALPALELNEGTEADIRLGLAGGRFDVPSVEAGTLLVLGAGYAGLMRFTGESDVAANAWVARQLCQLVLRGLGVTPLEAEQVAAREAEAMLGTART